MAFENLSNKLQEVFKQLRSKGKLTEADVKTAMREVKIALLEADVNFKIVKQFIKKVTDYDSVKAYEEATMEELMNDAQEASRNSAGEEALQLAMQNATVNGYPKSLYEACYSSTVNEYQEYADMFGMELSEFMGDEDEVEEEVISWVNEILVSQAIAEKEGLEVTDDNYKEDAEALAVDYGYESLDEFVSNYGEIYVKVNLMRERAIDFLYENAEIEEVSQEEYYQDEDLDLQEEYGTEILLEEDTE